MSELSVIAVVVTFNRRDLLRRLLDVLLTTPRLTEIVVVDNASTDGTPEVVAELARRPHGVPVHLERLGENTGGAGGFHTGMRVALDRGADLMWLMDDDGVPSGACLKTLLDQGDNWDFWGPAVLAEHDAGRLTFPIRLPGRRRVVHRMRDVEAAATDGVLPGSVIPFNGVLVTRDLAERIGLVREEFFIWGDDVEYRMRAEEADARIATIVDAHFLHPATDDLGSPMMFGLTTYNHSPSDLKHYCMARNNVVNLRRYRGMTAVAAFVAKTGWFYTFTRPSGHRLWMSARGIVAGLRGDFRGHRRYLA